jgi:hypothetical protein
MGLIDKATKEELAMADQFIADMKNGLLCRKAEPNTPSGEFNDDEAFESFKVISKSGEVDKMAKRYYESKE